jgi:hypothetical protein
MRDVCRGGVGLFRRHEIISTASYIDREQTIVESRHVMRMMRMRMIMDEEDDAEDEGEDEISRR